MPARRNFGGGGKQVCLTPTPLLPSATRGRLRPSPTPRTSAARAGLAKGAAAARCRQVAPRYGRCWTCRPPRAAASTTPTSGGPRCRPKQRLLRRDSGASPRPAATAARVAASTARLGQPSPQIAHSRNDTSPLCRPPDSWASGRRYDAPFAAPRRDCFLFCFSPRFIAGSARRVIAPTALLTRAQPSIFVNAQQ